MRSVTCNRFPNKNLPMDFTCLWHVRGD